MEERKKFEEFLKVDSCRKSSVIHRVSKGQLCAWAPWHWFMWTRKDAVAPSPDTIPNCLSSLKSLLVGSYPGRAEQTDSEGIYSSGLWTKPSALACMRSRECIFVGYDFGRVLSKRDQHGLPPRNTQYFTITATSLTHFYNKTQQRTSGNAMDWCLPGLSPLTPD